MTTREMGWLGVAILLFIELLHTPNNALDILTKPLNLGAKWSNLRSKHLIATGSSWLCFVSTQTSRWRHVHPPVPTETPNGFWGPNSRNRPSMVLRPKPPNPLEKYIRYASSTILTLDCSITKSSNIFAQLGQPSSWLGQHGLLLRMYSCLLVPQVSATHYQSSSHLGS